MKKNENGITIIVLIVTIVVMIIIAGITFEFSKKLVKDSELKNDITNMLLIQARAEVVYDKNQFDSVNNPLIGVMVNDELLENKISTDLADFYNLSEEKENWYIWDSNDENSKKELEDLKINIEENEYYMVNYIDGEVIYSEGYNIGNDTVYTLSEMKSISENN